MSTDEIRLKGMVFSLPLKRLGTFRVTPCWSMMIFEGKTRFPSASLAAMNVSMGGEVMYASFHVSDEIQIKREQLT